ncbi:MAG: tetratricopeptide repeat protein [Pseudomonadota bacterium]
MAIVRLLLLLLVTACAPLSQQHSNEKDKQSQADARIALGMEYLQLGQLDRAGQNFEAALTHAPNYYRAQLAQAIYLQHSGLANLAAKRYQALLDKHSNQPEVLLSYATFLCQQQQFHQAHAWFEKSIRYALTSQRVANYQNAALCAIKAENHQQAALYLVRALEYQPNRLDLRLHLAKVAIHIGDIEQAATQLTVVESQTGKSQATQSLWREVSSLDNTKK